jgi:hypothetical protein
MPAPGTGGDTDVIPRIAGQKPPSWVIGPPLFEFKPQAWPTVPEICRLPPPVLVLPPPAITLRYKSDCRLTAR